MRQHQPQNGQKEMIAKNLGPEINGVGICMWMKSRNYENFATEAGFRPVVKRRSHKSSSGNEFALITVITWDTHEPTD